MKHSCFGSGPTLNASCGAVLFLAGSLLLAPRLWAGGSGLNVVVVVNQASSNSVQLGNYYCQQRQVPPQNYLRIDWPYLSEGNTNWDATEFTNVLLNPLLSFLEENQLTTQIDYVVLSMDIPYRVTSSNSQQNNSTTSSLFYGFKPDPVSDYTECNLATNSTSAYAGAEALFHDNPPQSGPGPYFLVMMITGTNLAEAQMVVDQGVVSDSTFPTQTVYLAKSDDVARNVRFALFDDAIFNTRLRGNYSMVRTNRDPVNDMGPLLGCQSGLTYFVVEGDNFAPGSIADNLTSYGGYLFDEPGQLDILSFLESGATGTYGTVDEPCNYLQKFPSPQDYFWQARGFSLAECYYMSVTNPYLGLMVGEPLAAPFAQPGSGSWLKPGANGLLSGTTNLSVQFVASDPLHPLQQVDLFVDGAWAQTLTNIAPTAGNKLYVTINGYTTNYTVPANAGLVSVASNLALALNGSSYSNATKVCAVAHGDRIELRSMNLAKDGSQVSISVSNSLGTGAALTTFVSASRTNFLDSIAQGVAVTNYPSGGPPPGYVLELESGTTVPVGDFLRLTITKTNHVVVPLAVTNNVSGGTLSELTQALVDMVNTNATLNASDGVTAEDFVGYDPSIPAAQFNLVANTPGWNAAQIQANLSGSAIIYIFPSGTLSLDANLSDLQPRNHLYITAGVTNLAVTFGFNTVTQASGYHELTAVAYEGSSVHTETLATQPVQIQNGSLSATLSGPPGSEQPVGATLRFSVVANATGTIQLFSTGGLLGAVTNQSSAVFSVPGTNLDLGWHPVYAVVTTTGGQQYRTATQWIQLVNSFDLAITNPPPTLSWPATPGRTYNILTTTNLTQPFHFTASVTPTNNTAQWTDTNSPASQRFYRVQTAD